MRETFQLVSIKDGKQDTEDILLILKKIAAGSIKNDLKLLNYYYEVPINYPAKIDKIDGDCVEITVQQAQSAVLGLQKQTFLRSAAFPSGLGVHCFVEYVNVKNCFAVLGRFAFASIRAERRGAVRVNVDGLYPVSFAAEEQELCGHLQDISLTGIGMKSRQPVPAGLAENGTLRLNLPNSALTLPAEYVKTVNWDDLQIHAFSIMPDQQADKLIAQFIYSRQVEIIRDLKDQGL